MKRILCWLGAVLFLMLVVIWPVEASGEDHFPENANYLNLSNLEMIPGNSGMAKTTNPIRVKPGIPYTVVMDSIFMGRHADAVGYIQIEIKEVATNDTYPKLILADVVNDRYYIEFTPQTDYIHFMSFPMIPDDEYRAMMYEGNYSDFIRFETFAHPSTTTNYFGVVPMDYDNQLSLNDIKNLVTAKNPSGQAVPVTIEETNMINGNNAPGTYQMVLVANHAETYKRYMLDIKIIDLIKPVISAPEKVDVPVNQLKTLEEIKAMLTVTDNADLTLTNAHLIVVEDTYSSKEEVGNYFITFSVTDQSLNKQTHTLNVNIVDTRGPKITGPAAIFIYATDQPLSEEDILSRYTAFDVEEGLSKPITISANQYNQKTVPGYYQVSLQSLDALGNVGRFNLFIHVMDNRGPIFSTNELILSLSNAEHMTNQELIDWFYQKSSQLGYPIQDVQIIYDEYSNHITLGGSYYVYLTYTHEGISQLARVQVNVEEEQKPMSTMVLGLLIGTPLLIASTLYVMLRKRK